MSLSSTSPLSSPFTQTIGFQIIVIMSPLFREAAMQAREER